MNAQQLIKQAAIIKNVSTTTIKRILIRDLQQRKNENNSTNYIAEAIRFMNDCTK